MALTGAGGGIRAVPRLVFLLHVLFSVILLAVAYRTYQKAGEIDADNAT